MTARGYWELASPDAAELGDAQPLAPPADLGVCSYPTAHAKHHRPHPTTKRTACWACHPPAGVEASEKDRG